MENQKAISGDRIAHMHGVAEYMRVHAEERGLPKNEMYLLGLQNFSKKAHPFRGGMNCVFVLPLQEAEDLRHQGCRGQVQGTCR